MATESLIVQLKADSSDLTKGLGEANSGLEKLDANTKKSDTSLASMTKVAGAAGTSVLAIGTAALTVASAMATMVTMAAKSEQELTQLSRQAKMTTADFEAFSFATKQYGIEAEAAADISKDLADKLGEYAATGSGAFQDFVDVMGLSEEQAKATAEEFSTLSSDEVIGRMVSQMESAGVSGNQMTFVLESMGNDLSKLIPLFAGNSAELDKLTAQYNKINDSLQITNEEATQLTGAATSFDLLTSAMGNATNKIAAQLAPTLNTFFTSVAEVVPQATQVVVDFINSFKSADTITNIQSINNELASLADDAETYQSRIDSGLFSEEQIDEYERGLERISQRTEELTARREELANQKIIDDAEATEIGTITGGTFVTPEQEDEGEAEQEKLDESLARWEAYGESRKALSDELYLYEHGLGANKVESEQENLETMAAAYAQYSDARVEADKIMESNAKATEKSKTDAMQAGLSAASDINQALFDDNKAVGAGIIVADTAIGVQKALAQGGMFGWAQAAAIAASGAAQLANLQSATSDGGGSISSSSSTVSDADTSTITVTGTDSSGESSGANFTVSGDDDPLMAAIVEQLNERKISGLDT